MSDTLIYKSRLADDADFLSRVTACVATEFPDSDPRQWAQRWAPQMAASPGFAAAYESAILSGVPQPGVDQAVISDNQILAAVQSFFAKGRV